MPAVPLLLNGAWSQPTWAVPKLCTEAPCHREPTQARNGISKGNSTEVPGTPGNHIGVKVPVSDWAPSHKPSLRSLISAMTGPGTMSEAPRAKL